VESNGARVSRLTNLPPECPQRIDEGAYTLDFELFIRDHGSVLLTKAVGSTATLLAPLMGA
jgi:hypothetical protein